MSACRSNLFWLLRQLTRAALLARLGTSGAEVHAEIAIEDIIENVRRNEALYANLDVKLMVEYNVADRPAVVGDGGLKEITHQQADIHYVTQGDMFRFDRAGSANVGGEVTSLDRIRAFDGKETRIYEQGAIGNMINGRADEVEAVRPHMLFLSDVIHTPLSIYLSGHEAMASHPMGGKKWRGPVTMQASCEGTSERQGMRCHKIWITVSVRGAQYNRWELWLAEDRNYLPIEMSGWTFNYSKDLPVSEARTNEFREIAPNIWFPFDAEIVAYDPAALQREGRQAVNWRRRYSVEAASIDPHYDKHYFADVAFPDGTRVYEVKNEKISRSYVEGSPAQSSANPKPAPGPRRWWWLVIFNIAVLAICACVVAYRARSSRGAINSGTVTGDRM